MALDFVALVTAWSLTIELRFRLNPVMGVQLSRERLAEMAPPLVGVLALWCFSAIWMTRVAGQQTHAARLYSMRFSRTIILVSTVTIVAAFFSRSFGAPVSRSFVLLYAATSYCMLLVTGSLNQYIWRLLLKQWPPLVEKVAVLGRPEDAQTLSATFHLHTAARLAGLIVPGDVAPAECCAGQSLPVLGTTWQVAEVVNREKLNRVIILSNTLLSEEEYERCTCVLHRMGVVMSRALNVAWSNGNLILNSDFGMHLLEIPQASFTPAQEVVKRSFDVAFSIILLLLVAPVLCLAVLLIKLTSKGKVLYLSERVGKGGRHFHFLKLRTMYENRGGREDLRHENEQQGHLFKIKADPGLPP